MNGTNVPNEQIRNQLDRLSGEQRKAAIYALQHPETIGLASTREAAAAAGVTPNTFVRLSRTLGFDGFKDFKTQLARTSFQPTEQARKLQSRSASGDMAGLYSDILGAASTNLQSLLADNQTEAMQAAAKALNEAKKVYVLGVGIANALAQNFAYLGGMALQNIVALPRDGSEPSDGLIRAGKGDVLIAMTFKPYRREVVEAVQTAREQGVTVIAISDSPTAPHFEGAAHAFDVPVEGPQFFTSTVALAAFLEALMAFVIAAAPAKAVDHIERFHERRHRLGIYLEKE